MRALLHLEDCIAHVASAQQSAGWGMRQQRKTPNYIASVDNMSAAK